MLNHIRVKEIDPNILINNRTYLFSHTFKINKQQKNIEKHKKDSTLINFK